MRRILATIFILSLVSQLFAANIFSEVNAVPGTNRVVLNWLTKSESGVQSFIVLRSNDDAVYISLTKINAQGPGTRYEYVDQNVMFTDFSALFYKIRAIGKNGQIIEETSIIAHPNISGIFETWGAIKALFR